MILIDEDYLRDLFNGVTYKAEADSMMEKVIGASITLNEHCKHNCEGYVITILKDVSKEEQDE